MKKKNLLMLMLAATVFLSACKKDDDNTNNTPTPTEQAKDPNTAAKVSVDRFSDAAGMLQRRSASPSLPAANAAVNFDMAPFITAGYTPTGSVVEYYNFDVQPTSPAPIYVLFKEGETTPVANQLNIIDVIPGDAGYNDFWQVFKVTVPASYVANVVTSYTEITAKGYAITPTTMLVNCPVVPEGSTATKRIGGGNAGLIHGWYKNKLVAYFSFEEKALEVVAGKVPTSPIYVTFNKNPDPNDATSGPASGFRAEGNGQTHNVVQTVPADAAYSPLWSVTVYDNADFATVNNITTAQAANILARGVANVNCPVVSIK
jgi:hypothetical protein